MMGSGELVLEAETFNLSVLANGQVYRQVSHTVMVLSIGAASSSSS